MALFGETRDVLLINRINRELLNNIINQQVGYYKVNLGASATNIYGESLNKTWYPGVELYCLIDKQPLNISVIKINETNLNCEVLKFLVKRFFIFYCLNRFESSFILNKESDKTAEFVTVKTYTRLLLKFLV